MSYASKRRDDIQTIIIGSLATGLEPVECLMLDLCCTMLKNLDLESLLPITGLIMSL